MMFYRKPSQRKIPALFAMRSRQDQRLIGLGMMAMLSITLLVSPVIAAPVSDSGGAALREVWPQSRGYLTTPNELRIIAQKAAGGLEPYKRAVEDVLNAANDDWDYELDASERCPNSRTPAWLHNERGTRRLYARALAYHLTGDERYAEEARNILERIMTQVLIISDLEQQCRLNFAWGTPELVQTADLLESYWAGMTCSGPLLPVYGDVTVGTGECKWLFQNWLAKNPYYIVSYAAEENQSNWGAAATATTAYIADYLWDRPDIQLVQRQPPQLNDGVSLSYSPAEAYERSNELALARMNGYRVDFHSRSSCDFMEGSQQDPRWSPVKSQITETGIVPEDARRSQSCNAPVYNGEYQNYPQVYLGSLIQQCELMLRRGDPRCYDNIDNTDLPDYTFIGPDGREKTTHLKPGRGSLERAIKAIIVDSRTEWRHDSALEVAFRYYSQRHQFEGIELWPAQIKRPGECAQDVCFGTLTHGFASGEQPAWPPVVPPPSAYLP